MSGLLPDDMKELEGFGTPAGGSKSSGSSVPPKPPAPPSPSPAPPRPVTHPATPPSPLPKPTVPPVVPRSGLPPKPVVAAHLTDSGSFGAGGFGGGSGGLRVSLMPSELEGRDAPDMRKRVLALILVIVVETLVIGMAYFFVLRAIATQGERKTAITGRAGALAGEIRKAEADLKDSLAWNAQVAVAKETLDSHVRWTKLFTFIEAKTLPTVKYNSLSGDSGTGSVSLDAVGNSYRDVAEQIVILRNEPLIASVQTSSAAARVDENGVVNGVSFSLVLRFKPEAWLSRPAAVSP